jgi:aminoglycoside phosphotransferase (APT) family kinase protein
MTDTGPQPAFRAGAAVDAEGFLVPEASLPQDWAKLADYLKFQGLTLETDPAPRQFAGGFGNLNYLIRVDGEKRVLRRPPPGPLPPGGNDMGRESRVLLRLWREFPLAPRALLYCEDESVLGKPFFIMEYKSGRTIKGELPPDLVGHERALCELLVTVLGQFHAVDPAAVDLDTLGRPEGFLARTVEGWAKRCTIASADVHANKEPSKAAQEVMGWLRGQTPPEPDVTLLHNDYKLDNVLLSQSAPPEAVAVLDWDQCTRGDPLFDFATLLSYWTQPDDPAAMRELGQMPTKLPGFPGREEAVAMYARATGRDLSSFQFQRVLAMLKLGTICLQLFARTCRGEARDPRLAEFGRFHEGIFEFTVEIIHGRAF